VVPEVTGVSEDFGEELRDWRAHEETPAAKVFPDLLRNLRDQMNGLSLDRAP
jgi:hypothetical protein